MRRVLLLTLLLMTGVSLAAQSSDGAHADGTAQAQAQTAAASQPPKAARAQKQDAQLKKAARAKTAEDQPQAKKQSATTGAESDKKDEPQEQSEEPQTQTDKDPKLTSVPGAKALGMSILGNQEAPKALVIVPWKSSDVGRTPGISPMLDDSRQPVDKEVFMRALRYYEIKSQTKP